MKKQNYLLLLTLAWVLSLACNENDPIPDPQPEAEALTTSDFNFRDMGIARVENLDPNDLGSVNPTHVNYSVVLSTADLDEVNFGGKTFFEVDLVSGDGGVTAVVFNLYAPITVDGGTAAENLLGGQNERVFNLEDFASGGPSANSYFIANASIVKYVFNRWEQNRSFLFTEGTITLSGTSPDFTLDFDVNMNDNGRNIDGTFSGSTSGTFRVFENN